jgi:hypothetical protein
MVEESFMRRSIYEAASSRLPGQAADVARAGHRRSGDRARFDRATNSACFAAIVALAVSWAAAWAHVPSRSFTVRAAPSPGTAAGPGSLTAYLPLEAGETLLYRVQKGDERGVSYRARWHVISREAFGPGQIAVIAINDDSGPKPRVFRLDVMVADNEITALMGASWLRTPVRAGESWTNPVYSSRRRVEGEMRTTIVQVGGCRQPEAGDDDVCLTTRELDPRGPVTIRVFERGRGLIRMERYRSIAAEREHRPERIETLMEVRHEEQRNGKA